MAEITIYHYKVYYSHRTGYGISNIWAQNKNLAQARVYQDYADVVIEKIEIQGVQEVLVEREL